MRLTFFVAPALLCVVGFHFGDAAPSISAQPRGIVFTSDRGFEGPRLWLTTPEGTSVHRIAKGYTRGAAWSPEGRRLAFVARGQRGRLDVFVINADGSGLRRITRTSVDESEPTWSPDGRRLAFVSSRRRHTDIFVAKANGTSWSRLTGNNACPEQSPAWSPNGRWIVFAGCGGYPPRLYLVRPDGTGRRSLPFRGEDPDWSPDGKRLAYRRSVELRVAALDGSGERTLASNVASPGGPAWSPDGRTLVFVRRAVRCTYEEATLFLIEADGTAERPLFRSPSCASDYEPDW